MWKSALNNTVGASADETSCVSIHPAIDHALTGFAPHIAGRAAEVIRQMLSDRYASDRSDSWSGSCLTGDGFPFELSFSTSDERARFTLEPGPSGLDPRRRLDVAESLINMTAASPLPSEVMETLKTIQTDGQLKYGAWIGCRISENDITLKLYSEVPLDGCRDSVDMPSLKLHHRAIIPKMIAYTPVSREFETYLRVPSFEPHELPAVLAPAGMEDRARWVMEFLEDAYGHVIRERLPGPSVGVSYASDQGLPRVTLHFYARALWGSDARIRRGFSRVASMFGWNPESYLNVTRPIAERESWKCFHGIFGITLDRSSQASLTIGVRPVAP
jgi:hypothetical protein